MALIVEDGTGKADAESYLSVAEAKALWDGRGVVYSGYADAVIEQKLREATQYVDSIARYKAIRLTAAQALEFPRSGLKDWSGYDVTGVPARVKQATAELASKAFTESLYSDADRGGQIKSESVGPLSVTYADGAPAEKLFTAAMNLLRPYIRKPGDIQGGPVYGGSDESYFSLGMQENPGAGTNTLVEPE